MKHLKTILIFLYVAVIVMMAAATIVEKYKGTAYVGEYWYGSWWFSVLWALLAAAAIVWFLKQRVRKVFAVVLHLSFIAILAGALLTHLTSRQGMLHLRKGESTNTYLVQEGKGIKMHSLPFRIALKDFEVKYHEGTMAHADYVTKVTILPLPKQAGSPSTQSQESNATISMNKILSYQGYRFYQSSYDPDMQGSILAVNSDPWGIPVTYTGYALLFIALIWMLFDPKGQYRQILRNLPSASAKGGRAVILLLTVCSACGHSMAATTIPKETASRLGELYINYNDRICPLQTFALDFTKKLTGKRYFKDADGNRYTAEQLLANFIFFGDEWEKQPVIKMKGGPLKTTLQLPDRCSFSSFFNEEMGGYILGPYVQEAAQGNRDKFHQDVMKVDDKLMMLVELRQGKPLKIFPAPSAEAQHPSLGIRLPTNCPTEWIQAGRSISRMPSRCSINMHSTDNGTRWTRCSPRCCNISSATEPLRYQRRRRLGRNTPTTKCHLPPSSLWCASRWPSSRSSARDGCNASDWPFWPSRSWR